MFATLFILLTSDLSRASLLMPISKGSAVLIMRPPFTVYPFFFIVQLFLRFWVKIQIFSDMTGWRVIGGCTRAWLSTKTVWKSRGGCDFVSHIADCLAFPIWWSRPLDVCAPSGSSVALVVCSGWYLWVDWHLLCSASLLPDKYLIVRHLTTLSETKTLSRGTESIVCLGIVKPSV